MAINDGSNIPQVPTGLNPTAFFLTKAIKQTETNGSANQYTAPGKSGEYGAYQFTEPTWNTFSKQYLGSAVPLKQATPEQQNEVAYKAIADQLSQGHTQSEVASWWNSGKYDAAATGTGTNKYGAAYDVPGYVNKVKNNYQSVANQFSGKANLDSLKTNLAAVPGQLASAITSLPGNKLGQAIGNSLGGVAGAIPLALQGKGQQALDTLKVGTQMGAQANSQMVAPVAGDVAQAVALPASLASGGLGLLPEGASTAGRIGAAGLKYGLLGALGSGGHTAAEGGTAGQTTTSALIGGGLGALGGLGGQAAGEGVSALQDKAAWQKVQDLITPKLTAAEQRAAMAEGRVTRGGTSLLGGTKPDIVAPSEQTQQNTATVLRNIPGAGKMNDEQLAYALKEKTTAMAKDLKPNLQAIPIDQKVTGQAFSEWKALKTAQADTPEFVDNQSGNTKFQQQFENRLKSLEWDIQNPETGKMQVPTPKNADDVWEARKAYDESIPPNVKNANAQSAPQLQLRQKMWLENRDILNRILDQVSQKLPESTQPTFREMSNMYNARQTIVKNTKINTEGTPGLASHLLREGLKYGAGITVGSAGAGLLGHFLNSTQQQ